METRWLSAPMEAGIVPVIFRLDSFMAVTIDVDEHVTPCQLTLPHKLIGILSTQSQSGEHLCTFVADTISHIASSCVWSTQES